MGLFGAPTSSEGSEGGSYDADSESGSGPLSADIRPPSADIGPPSADIRPASADIRPPSADIGPPSSNGIG